MKKILLLLGLFFSVGANAQQLAPLSVEKIMRDPKAFIGTSPSGIYWSEDSKTIYFQWNPDKNLADSLYAYSLADKKIRKVSLEERRNLPPSTGVYNRNRTLKLYTQHGDIYLLNTRNRTTHRLTNTVEIEDYAVFNHDESKVLFRRGNNIFSISLAPKDMGSLVQYTDFKEGKKPQATKLNEQETWLKQDQLDLFDILRERKVLRDSTEIMRKLAIEKRPKPIYLDQKRALNIRISPDCKFVTYVLVEPPKGAKSTVVPNYVTESGFTENIPARTKVGAPLATHEFWVYDIEKDTVRQVSFKDLPGIKDKPDYLKDYPDLDSAWKDNDRGVYVSGPFYSEKGDKAVITLRSVDNKDRWIALIDLSNLALKILDRQRDEAWIGGPGIGYNQSSGTVGWVDDQHFYFQSEATGYSHLYVVNVVSGEKKQLTEGKFEVHQVNLSRDKKHFYLLTNEVHPGETHWYKMPVRGGAREKITNREGGHEVVLSPDEKKIAVRYSNSNTPWELYVMDNRKGATYVQITQSLTDEFKSYPWRQPNLVTIPASDGASIYARVYEPEQSNGKAVIFVHGAGYLQNAHKWWSQYFREYMFHNLLVDKGYTVLDMDYRASAGYGRDWRTGIYRHMGGKDLSDNIDGAKWLAQNYPIDPSKIGIYGGSYGGFITLMAQFTAPGVFAAGAALRPVTDWAAYNHGYTSNILNEPHTDSLAYRRSSPIYHAEGLEGKLLICHGMIDVNVHFQDVVRLTQRLIELGKENWELAVYPLEDHGFVTPSSWTDEYKRILKLFEEM